MNKKLIRFDWALKKLLRHKANFGILEGFLSELLRFDVTIESILESEGNKKTEDDKFNRVDILVRTATNELVLVEIQNDAQIDYFQRMMYGVGKLVTEYIKEGEHYSTIKKIYSINIVYFGLGQGEDYLYEYKGEFIGLNTKNILKPTLGQKDEFKVSYVSDLFPKYFILKVNNFNDTSHNSIDEWIYFLKNNTLPNTCTAKGLKEAGEKMRYEALSSEEKEGYDRFQENRRIESSVTYTAQLEGARVAKKETIVDFAKKLILRKMDNEFIEETTGLSFSEIQDLRAEIAKN
jgi:predicted transposase/invertase (TIGR01784 family)